MRAAVLIASLAATPAAGDFSLVQPVDCVLDQDCYIQQYMDHDPSDAAHDFACGSLTYDTHKGTDFALPNLAAQAAGVNVLAAAAGTVVGVRNDMVDALQVGPDAPDVSDRFCGNGLVIRHTGGFETQYCHMAQGSVIVTAGQSVEAGDVLGQIALSGQTQFPHLHLSVRRFGKPIDPFNADGVQSCPDTTQPSLWADDIATPAGGIVEIGLSDKVPDFDDVKAGTASVEIARDSPALVGWSHVFGIRDGDQLLSRFTRPDGTSFDHTDDFTRTQARIFRAFGKRTPRGGWPRGAYVLEVVHLRDAVELDRATLNFEID